RAFSTLRSLSPNRSFSSSMLDLLQHFLDEFAASRFLHRRLELLTEIHAHLLRALFRPQPDIARIAIERLTARLAGVEIAEPRGLALDHRERGHHPARARRAAMRTRDARLAIRSHHDVRADVRASGAFVLVNRHPG